MEVEKSQQKFIAEKEKVFMDKATQQIIDEVKQNTLDEQQRSKRSRRFDANELEDAEDLTKWDEVECTGCGKPMKMGSAKWIDDLPYCKSCR